MILAPFVLNKGLMAAVDAAPGSAAEALSVPFQQITRVYMDKGEAAFTQEELDYLYTCIDKEDFAMYDPDRRCYQDGILAPSGCDHGR